MTTSGKKDDDSAELQGVAKFGDLIAADHAVLGDPNESSRRGDRVALVVQDTATWWIDCYPSAHKSTEEAMKALQNFAGAQDVVKRLYSDNSGELDMAATKLMWRHDTATPKRPHTNGVAESAVRKVLEGTRAVLLQSGLPHKWWAEAAKCFCCLRNTCD